jgi:hypothetical protein
MRGTSQPKLGSTEHEKKEAGKIEANKIIKQQRMVKKNYVNFLALPVGLT